MNNILSTSTLDINLLPYANLKCLRKAVSWEEGGREQCYPFVKLLFHVKSLHCPLCIHAHSNLLKYKVMFQLKGFCYFWLILDSLLKLCSYGVFFFLSFFWLHFTSGTKRNSYKILPVWNWILCYKLLSAISEGRNALQIQISTAVLKIYIHYLQQLGGRPSVIFIFNVNFFCCYLFVCLVWIIFHFCFFSIFNLFTPLCLTLRVKMPKF